VVDARLDLFDGPENADDLLRFGRWLARAARWQKKGITGIELLVCFFIVMTLIGLVWGAIDGTKKDIQERHDSPLHTVLHDKHRWVVGHDGAFFVHHPDCEVCAPKERP
jgi:hypothetical protein